MSTGDFWDEMSGAYVQEASFDPLLQGKELDGPAFSSVRDMVAAAQNSLELPVDAGTRVRFIANLGSVLSYADVPDPRVAGTVITVRTGSGDATNEDNRVFVAWDDGVFRAVAPEHLQTFNSGKKANNVRMVVSDLGDLSMFFSSSSRADELVHKATKDLWSVTQKGGQFVINRLFKDNGEPLKV